jgi:hypothetical protein
VYQYTLEEELGSDLRYNTLLASSQNGHLRESINNHEYTVISMLGGGETRHVVHRDGFPGPDGSRQRGVQSFFFNGWLGNGAGSAGSDILTNILSKLWPIEILLYHFHCLLHAKVSYHPTIVGFPNQIRMLT